MDPSVPYYSGLHAVSYDLMRRDCIQCQNAPISCPQCSSGEVCIQRAGNCTVCTQNICVLESQSGAMSVGPSKPSGPNVGAIIGGVIGGLAAIIIVTFLIWRLCIRDRRQNLEEGYEDEEVREKPGEAFQNMKVAHRASTHTVASFASTAFTRASNVIQIAFFPGITDGSVREDNLTPPVPPIPIPTSEAGSRSNSPFHDNTDHYFMPELRDSQYDGFSDDGTSVGGDRRSLAPSLRSTTPSMLRNSVASTIYRSDAIVSATPAQAVQRSRAAVVSVRPGTAKPPSPVPSMPPIDYKKFGAAPKPQASASSSPNLGTGELAASDSSTSGVSSVSNKAQYLNVAGSSVSASNSSGDRLSRSDSPQLIEAIQSATKRASRQPTHGGLGSARREVSPFADINAIPEDEPSSHNG